MKYLSYINCFLIVLAILAFGSTNGRAQDVMKIDSGKPAASLPIGQTSSMKTIKTL